MRMIIGREAGKESFEGYARVTTVVDNRRKQKEITHLGLKLRYQKSGM
jgi:hypothetical protein